MSKRTPKTPNVIKLPGELVRRWYRGGLAHTANWFSYQVSSRYREWKLGVQTGKLDHGFSVGDDGDHLGYEPIDIRCFETMLDHLQIRPGADVFLDYGCGKGRALILAALRPFRVIIGVERSRSLCAIADKNVHSALPHLRCRDVRIVNADAAAYRLPGSVTTVFMFNPFRGEVLSAVLDQIRASVIRTPRSLKIAYVLPANEPDALSGCAWLTKVSFLPSGFWTHVKCLLYEVNLDVARLEILP